MLGTCATLAVTTAASNAIGMGLATTFVLVCSNAVISLLKKIIPDKVRIPAYITIVAGFVTIVQLLIKAYVRRLTSRSACSCRSSLSTASFWAVRKCSPAKIPCCRVS